MTMNRRDFCKTTALGLAGLAAGCATGYQQGRAGERLFFTSDGKTCLINADGSGFEILQFDVPGQATWQPGPFLSDGRRVIFLSMEPRRDGPGRPFDQFYTLTPTHLWLYDLDRKTLTEIATREREEVFYTPQALINDDRILVQAPRSKLGQVLSMNLDGSDKRAFTGPGEGLPYGFSVSPDHQRIAFHLASPQGYQIWTSDVLGGNRQLVISDPDHLYFGPAWSPDGEWLLFQDCRFKNDPGHDASDLCVARPDGRDFRVLTQGQSHWFGATYGNPQRRGGGSNVPVWTQEGEVLYARLLPGARVAWEYQTGRPDTDHFNRDWKPERARGGTEICRLNPRNGETTVLTQHVPPLWDLRPNVSKRGGLIAFCRCGVGESPALWVMKKNGEEEKLLTQGINQAGADHPRWLP